MDEIKCYDCGLIFGSTLDGKDYIGLCGRCYDERKRKDEYKRRREEAKARPLTTSQVINSIENWWRAYKGEEYDEPEDDIVHEKIMAEIKNLFKR